jgi:hypothetical protein
MAEVSELRRLEWIRLHIDKLLSSPRWQRMKDFQRGWYIELILQSTRSARVGYLPVTERLWELAGAHRREMWNLHSQEVMACFKTRTFDGKLWMYNDRLLKELAEQSDKYGEVVEKKDRAKKQKDRISFLFNKHTCSLEELDLAFDEIWDLYVNKSGKKTARDAFPNAVFRLTDGDKSSRDRPEKPGFSIGQAVQWIGQQAKTYSEIHRAKLGMTDTPLHFSTFLNKSRYLDEPDHWKKSGAKPNSKVKHGIASIRQATSAIFGDADGSDASSVSEPGDGAGDSSGIHSGLGGTGSEVRQRESGESPARPSASVEILSPDRRATRPLGGR